MLLFTCNWGLVLRSCVNTSVTNVTIGYELPCYSQGRVTDRDFSRGWLEFVGNSSTWALASLLASLAPPALQTTHAPADSEPGGLVA